MKKLISFLLVTIMVLSCSVLTFSGFALEDDEHPTIYLYGANTEAIYSAEGEQLFPKGEDFDAMDVVMNALMPCLEKLAVGLIIDDYELYAKEFYDAFVPIFGPIALDKNGEATNGSGTAVTSATQDVPEKSSGYEPLDYRMHYDWRLSPLATALELKEYIDRVLEATGETKVNLMGRCYSANVIEAYLTVYEGHALAHVDDVTYITSSVLGLDLLGAIFTGNLKIDGNYIDAIADYYFNYLNFIEDEATKQTVQSLLELLTQVKVMDFTGETLNKLINEIKYDLIPPIIRDTFGSMPSMWSMVPAESYDKAIEFIFGDCRQEYAGLIEKTDKYHNEVQKPALDVIKRLQASGIDFVMIAKYNIPELPVYEGFNSQSDGFTLTWRQAFGGEYSSYGETLPQNYISINKNNRYLSPDYKVDASTCLFPEKTWFVKDLQHMDFPDNLDRTAMKIMNSELSVSDGVVSQFIQYLPESGELVDVDGPDKDLNKKPSNPLQKLFSFLAAFFKILTKWLNNGILPIKSAGIS
ncbi:MAG: esterase/lipase family protein [Acutalibacteraceae bacterium]